MKKTAMRELIDFIENQEYNFLNKEQLESCNKIKTKAIELLEIEKQQIVDANIEGMEFIPVDPSRYQEDAEQYYNELYGK